MTTKYRRRRTRKVKSRKCGGHRREHGLLIKEYKDKEVPTRGEVETFCNENNITDIDDAVHYILRLKNVPKLPPDDSIYPPYSRAREGGRNQRGGALSQRTTDMLTAQYNEHARPNLMEIDEFVKNNNITEPFHEIVAFIRDERIHGLLSPMPELDQNNSPEIIQAYNTRRSELVERARPR